MVECRISSNSIHFTLFPVISGHTLPDHERDKDMAAVLFKTAQTIAERNDLAITQTALQGVCQKELGWTHIIASYPDHPLLFENLCWGFRAVLLHGVGQPTENEAGVPWWESDPPDLPVIQDRGIDFGYESY